MSADRIGEGLGKIEIMCKEPAGTFYQFHNICKTGQDSKALTKGLLRESRMTTVRGIAFDKLRYDPI